MNFKKLWRTDTGGSFGSSVSPTTESLNHLGMEKPKLDNKVLIKFHHKKTTYRIRFDLGEDYHKLRKHVMVKLNFPENEDSLVFGYVDVDYKLIRIYNEKDFIGCKKYTESHYNTEYIRILVYDSKDSKKTIVRDYKDMETLRKGDLAVAERSRILPVNICPQGCKEEFNEPPKSFKLVGIREGVVSTHKVDYEFKNGYDGLRKAVHSIFEDHFFFGYFDRCSSLTLIRDEVDFNESYRQMYDNRNIVIYYFPSKHARKMYEHHFQEVNKRGKLQQITELDEKQDQLHPPKYHTLSELCVDPKEEQGVRYFKIRWSTEIPYYGFFKYDPHKGILVFKDIVNKKGARKLGYALGYFDEDMDSVTIDTDEDLEECARAVKGQIIIIEVKSWQSARKADRMWSEELSRLQQEERNNWGN